MKNVNCRRIILITGPKHSGKSLAARALEKLTGGAAFDLDDCIEKETGRTPRELYTESEELFKKAEEKALVSLLQLKEGDDVRIIAAGGGLVDNSKALARLSAPLMQKAEVFIVFLELSAETAWQRIVHSDLGLPPFVNTENPKETHKALHERRADVYKALAHLTIAAENKSPEEIAGEIARFLQL